MTLHVLLPTADHNQLAWVTDTCVFLGLGNTSEVEKITYLPDYNCACSWWGALIAASAHDNFVECVKAQSVDIRNPDDIVRVLKEIAQSVDQTKRKPGFGEQFGHGVIIATFLDAVRIYQASITNPPLSLKVPGYVVCGDLYNPARIFPRHYYGLSRKSLPECLALGIHTMRLANITNSGVIGSPDAWVYDGERFSRLTEQELLPYLRCSKSLDATILEKFRQSVP